MDLIDCQGFAGGMTLGIVQAGFTLVHKAEEPAGFGMAMCDVNRHLLGDKWQAQAAEPAEWDVPSGGADLVAGNPPCSGFSVMSPSSFRGVNSPINACMRNLFAYAARVKPSAVVMESVGAAFKIGLPLMRELAEGLSRQTGTRYYVTHVLQNNLSLGGCTRRRRYFLVVTDCPFGVEQAPLRWVPTLGDAVGDLVNMDLTWDAQPYQERPTWWSLSKRSLSGMTDGHISPELAPKHEQRLHDITDYVDWPSGWPFEMVIKSYYDKFGDFPESWKYQSTSKTWGHLTRDKVIIERGFKIGGYSQTRHWKWDEPGHVLTGHGPNQIWHPEGRLYTHREAARIMGFPDDWKIAPLQGNKLLSAMWGKGVSVDCGRWIGTWVRESLMGRPGSITGTPMPDGDDTVIDASSWWKLVPSQGQRGVKLTATVALPADDEADGEEEAAA